MTDEAKKAAEAHAAERRADTLRALEEERLGYERLGKADRVKEVDAAIKTLTGKPAGRRAPGKTTTEG